jgi:hypothetical protein
MRPAASDTRERRLGRYLLHGKIAQGGMATVHFGRLVGEGGFSRVVAIKRMGSHLAEDPEFRAMFLDEARLASRIRHPNVISTIDVGSSEEGLFLVMEYVAGESLASLLRASSARGVRIPVPIALRILIDTLYGLHAAHTATDEGGRPLDIVHRDVSPQNILVAVDGLARVLDFGIAKAAGSSHTTRDGQLKGKFRYMAPEQVSDKSVSPRTDVYSAAVVLWETLTGEHLFGASNDAAVVARVLEGVIPPPSKRVPTLPKELDALVQRGLARDPDERFGSALEMAEALEAFGGAATARQVGVWVEDVAGEVLQRRREQIAQADALGADPTQPVHRADLVTQTHTFDLEPGPVPFAAAVAVPERSLHTQHSQRSRSRWPWAILAAVALMALAGFELMKTRDPGLPAAIASSSPPPEPSAAIPPKAPDVAAASAVVAPSASPSPPSESTAAALPSAPRANPAPPSARSGGHPKSSAATKPSCTPPYFEDPSGIRRVKPECL